MFGELEGGVELDSFLVSFCGRLGGNAMMWYTSCRSTNGGPSAISSAFVPGRILRDAAALLSVGVWSLPWSS